MLYGRIAVENRQWDISIAADPWEMAQGLGGLSDMPAQCGMLFDLGCTQKIEVTTVPMLFPIDIAFFSDSLAVTEIYRDVQPGYLVTSTSPARYFLEVNTGELEDIENGDQAAVEFLTLEETPGWMSSMVGFMGLAVMAVFITAIARDFMKGALGQAEEKPELYKPGGERLLPQTRPADGYEIETDRMGNIIITRKDEPGKDMFLQFESDKELVYSLLKKGEKKDLDAGWKVLMKRNEPRASMLDELWTNSVQPKKSTTSFSPKPTKYDVTIETWQERDRLGIWIIEKRTGMVIAEWWDEDAREMFDQGFFKPGVPQRAAEKPSRGFIASVLDYAESVGILASAGPAAVIPEHSRKPVSKSELEFLPDSPEFLAYTIDDIGYRDRIDSAFLSAIARAKGKRS